MHYSVYAVGVPFLGLALHLSHTQDSHTQSTYVLVPPSVSLIVPHQFPELIQSNYPPCHHSIKKTIRDERDPRHVQRMFGHVILSVPLLWAKKVAFESIF